MRCGEFNAHSSAPNTWKRVLGSTRSVIDLELQFNRHPRRPDCAGATPKQVEFPPERTFPQQQGPEQQQHSMLRASTRSCGLLLSRLLTGPPTQHFAVPGGSRSCFPVPLVGLPIRGAADRVSRDHRLWHLAHLATDACRAPVDNKRACWVLQWSRTTFSTSSSSRCCGSRGS
jgi:hypothetical protein